jgi:hypothetical protein
VVKSTRGVGFQWVPSKIAKTPELLLQKLSYDGGKEAQRLETSSRLKLVSSQVWEPIYHNLETFIIRTLTVVVIRQPDYTHLDDRHMLPTRHS